MGREGRDYWEAQLSEYWDSGLTIQEYSELNQSECRRFGFTQRRNLGMSGRVPRQS